MTSQIVIARQLPTFKFRARHTGPFEWTCPDCGWMTTSVLRRTTWVIQCGNPDCRIVGALGNVFHRLPRGRRLPPGDIVIPSNLREAFPEGDVGRWWSSGSPVHCVHDVDGVSLSRPPLTEIAPNK